ncbi:MAG: slipin family protein [Spirochaetes bacterium]|nr:slipin family protein [Spirochaetota bacterium]
MIWFNKRKKRGTEDSREESSRVFFASDDRGQQDAGAGNPLERGGRNRDAIDAGKGEKGAWDAAGREKVTMSKEPLIKNVGPREKRKDFRMDPVGLGVLAFLVILIGAALTFAGRPPRGLELGILLGTPVVTAGLMTLFPRWSTAVKFLLVLGLFAGIWQVEHAGLALAIGAVGALLAPATQMMAEWERAIVLRLGKFHRVRGPGLFILFPLMDRIARVVDLRIRVTDFSAETTLTRDSVTVTVDALCFWLVWDPEKAVLEVQNYEEAVVLSSKTALRNAISKNDLSTFLERGEEIEEQIRSEVDRKTTEWGITVQHIEITDIQIPRELQNTMSRLAQMEREKQGRVQLAEAEIEAARRFVEAARVYGKDRTALRLRKLAVLNEGVKAGNSLLLMPNELAKELHSGGLLGSVALKEARRKERRKNGNGEDRDDCG